MAVVRRLATQLSVAAVLLNAGCRQERTLLTAPPPVDTSGGGAAPLQRVALVLTVRVAPDDSALARSLGWDASVVPLGTVEIRRLDRTDTAIVAATSDSGTVRFERLLPGEYTVSVLRVLDAAEAARLEAADRDVDAVAGGLVVTVSTPETDAVLVAYAGRRGSLVVSEFRVGQSGDVFYPFGAWLELYNNSDTIIVLDGKLVGEGGLDVYGDFPTYPCEVYQDYRTDSLGLWARMVYRFPGSGTDYPLAPGEAVLIATDAADHREVLSFLDDLRMADFEFIGPADADNPGVPNMLNVGPGEWALGHGLSFVVTRARPFVAQNVDVTSLPVSRPPNLALSYVRIPRAAILDLGTFFLDPSFQYTYPLCEPQVHPSLDRQYARLIPVGEGSPESVQRRVLRTLPDGRAILLRTKTSSRDFQARVPRTPGSVP